MKYYLNLLSEYLKEVHNKRLDKEHGEWKYLHFND